MKSLPRRALRTLILAVIVTVVVAWALAAWSPEWTVTSSWGSSRGRTLERHFGDTQWLASVERHWPRPNAWWTNGGVGVRWITVVGVDGFTRYHQCVLRSGWPFEALECRREWIDSSWPPADIPPRFEGRWLGVAGGIPMPQSRIGESTLGRHLPLIPHWSGFLLNTFIAWAILFAAGLCDRALRGWRRRRRGLCPACGHQLGALANAATITACPECGATIKSRVRAPVASEPPPA